MKKTFWNKRIPTFVAMFLIAIGIVITTYLVQSGVVVISRASPSYTPQNVRITNITDSSFTISYTTKAPSSGSVSFGTSENTSSLALDDRDQASGGVASYAVHYITVHNVSEKTKYFFRITSNQTVFLNDGNPFTATTAPKLDRPPTLQNPLAGRIIFPNQNHEAIVYLNSKNAQTISTLAKSDGSYILPLNSLRSLDLTSYATFTNDQILTMLIASSEGTSSVALTASQINPVPNVALFNNYDFTLTTSSVSSESAIPLGFPSFSANPSFTKDPDIVTPKKDEGFVDSQPLLKGVASPGATVKVVIHSQDTLEAQVTADKNGNWSFRPETPLAPGQHTVSIITRDTSGILKTITKPFIVYASGTQIPFATPSASPIPSLTQTPTSQVRPTTSVPPSPSPTQTLPTPTTTPTPTATPIISQGPLPPPGTSSVQIFGIAGFSTIIVGAVLFLLSRWVL